MATSGSKSVTVTSWNTLKFSWSEKSQSIDNNTTTISWKMELIATSSGRISSTASKDWSVTVNGTKYSGTNTVGISNNATKTLASGTTTIKHNSDGTKSFSYSFSQEFAITFSGSTIGTKSGSGSGTLDTIPRGSTLSASNGTLGTAQTLTVTRYSSGFTHTVTYTCGSVSDTLCIKSTDTSLSFTPPLSLASQNTKGTTVSIKFTVTTYNGSNTIGTKTTTISCSMPSSVKPSCSISISDAAGFYSTFGAYVKGKSKLAVTITPTISYGSAIASYSATANGAKYTAASFETDVLLSSGTLTVAATVTDERGRKGEATKDVTVLDYSVPQISLLKVKRCASLEDGTEDIYGDFAQVTFSATASALNNKNSVKYVLEYKQTGEEWENAKKIEMTDFANTYEIVEGVYRFAADSGLSYNVRVVVSDTLTENSPIIKTTPLSTGEVMEHWRADGKGMGFGKIGEIENGADFGWKIRANNGFINILLDPETDLNEVIKPNTYYGENVDTYNYLNCPVTSGTFTLEVASGGDDGQLMQTLTVTSKDKFVIYKRFYHSTDGVKSWGEWKQTYTATGNLLWSGAYYMKASQTATLSQKVSEQPHGIQLVFSGYTDGEAKDQWFNSFFISKYEVALHNGVGHNFLLTAGASFQYLGEKYLYISDDKIVGLDNNERTGTGASGITYANNMFVLRYVIGV